MAATDLHVFGPALVEIGLTGGATVGFGYTVEGVRIRIEQGFEDVMTDDAGFHMPGDVQWGGQTATIEAELIRWDEALFRTLEAAIRGRSGGAITSADIGTLMLAGARYFTARISGSQRTGLPAEDPYRFSAVWPIGEISSNHGTRVSRRQLSLRAIPINGILYTRS